MKKTSLSFLLVATVFPLGLAVQGCKEEGASCVPLTCAQVGATCGYNLDQCGGMLDCGTCAAGQTCGAGGPNICGVGTCNENSCADQALDCGIVNNNCGNLIDCGICDGVVGPGDGGGAVVGTGGTSGTGGTDGSGTGSASSVAISPLGEGVFVGGGSTTTDKWAEGAAKRDSQYYYFITNGWGKNCCTSVATSWLGTSFTATMSGPVDTVGGEPLGYPAMFCGNYADKVDKTKCGLPIDIATATSVMTGWTWDANGNSAQYNAAYDIWLGDGSTLQSYVMVWLRDPAGQTPANNKILSGQTIDGLAGSWDVWTGSVGGKPIINYVRPEGQDVVTIEFDALKVVKDALGRGAGITGAKINSIAVGFEVWNNVTNVKTVDFYVDPK